MRKHLFIIIQLLYLIFKLIILFIHLNEFISKLLKKYNQNHFNLNYFY